MSGTNNVIDLSNDSDDFVIDLTNDDDDNDNNNNDSDDNDDDQ